MTTCPDCGTRQLPNGICPTCNDAAVTVCRSLIHSGKPGDTFVLDKEIVLSRTLGEGSYRVTYTAR